MNILFASGHLPSPEARQAGQKISYYLCQYLARRNTVHLLAFSAASEFQTGGNDSGEIFASRTILPVTSVRRLLGVVSAPTLPLCVAARHQGQFCATLESVLRREHFDAIIFDHMAMWQYAGMVAGNTVRVGIAHDVLSQLWARRAAKGWHYMAEVESRRLRNWQRKVMRNLDLACAFNSKDCRLLSELPTDLPLFLLQPWFSRPSKAGPQAEPRADKSLVFTGAFDRNENVDAVEFAVDDILPQITSTMPQSTLYVTGAATHMLGKRVAGHPAVRFVGFLPDLPAFLSQMQIALLPLRLGAGIKTKVLECMAAGVAVVTTPVGAEGIPGENGVHYLVGNTARELAGHAIFLLRNRDLCGRMGESAREFIRTNYDFEKSAQEFESTLAQCVNRRQPETSPMRDPARDDECVDAPRAAQMTKHRQTQQDCVR